MSRFAGYKPEGQFDHKIAVISKWLFHKIMFKFKPGLLSAVICHLCSVTRLKRLSLTLWSSLWNINQHRYLQNIIDKNYNWDSETLDQTYIFGASLLNKVGKNWYC